VAIFEEYLEIWARGGTLPKIFYKECHDGKTLDLCVLHKNSEEDSCEILMSVYSKKDSVYLDGNNAFIDDINLIRPGATVATLALNSARKLACGQTTPGVEDICTNGNLAVTLRPRSAYDELARALISIHDRFIDSHDANETIIIADDDIDISKILKVHHEAKTAGFTKIEFAKLPSKAYMSYNLVKDTNFAKDLDRVLSKFRDLQSSCKTEIDISSGDVATWKWKAIKSGNATPTIPFRFEE